MADDPEKDTPAPAPDPEPETDPTPTHDHQQCAPLIAGLNERVETLENTLNTVISIKPDTTPVKRPWTHRKFMR